MKVDKNKMQLVMARACMNVNDVAKKGGVSYNTLMNAMHGYSLSIKSVGCIAKALGVDPIEIMEESQ